MDKYILSEGIYVNKDRSDRLFQYSDGEDAENYLLDLMNNVLDLSTGSEELFKGIRDWPSQYHLNPRRADLIRPLNALLKGGSVLEIGSGCGAITRYLGELECRVTALEGSYRRAQITARRCIDLADIRVYNDNIENFSCDELFDNILLIGVLEYSSLFMQGPFPPLTMLEKVKQFLKPGGRLIIAIENKVGLKYWAGAPEDHAGNSFFGIENKYDPSTAVTFGKAELKDLLLRGGFPHTEFLYPFPDYKLPEVILREKAFETGHFEVLNLLYEKFDYTQGQSYETSFNTTLAAETLHKNKLLAELSNSFLVIAGPSDDFAAMDDRILAFSYSSLRKKSYCKENIFQLSENGRIEVIKRNTYTDPYPSDQPVRHLVTDEKYLNGKLFSGEILKIVTREGWATGDLAKWATRYYKILQDHSSRKNEFIEGKFLDLTPFNILVPGEDEAAIFDQEWYSADEVPLYYIFFRGLVYSLDKVFAYAPPAEGTSLNLIELIVAIINSIFPFDIDHLRECIRLEEKYFSFIPLSPGKAFAHGNVKVKIPFGNFSNLLLQKENELVQKKNELVQKKNELVQRESELNQKNELLEKVETERVLNKQQFEKQIDQLENELLKKDEKLSEQQHVLEEQLHEHQEIEETLKKTVSWYKQTYEYRSFTGVLKEKSLQAIRKGYVRISHWFLKT